MRDPGVIGGRVVCFWIPSFIGRDKTGDWELQALALQGQFGSSCWRPKGGSLTPGLWSSSGGSVSQCTDLKCSPTCVPQRILTTAQRLKVINGHSGIMSMRCEIQQQLVPKVRKREFRAQETNLSAPQFCWNLTMILFIIDTAAWHAGIRSSCFKTELHHLLWEKILRQNFSIM